MHELSRTPIIRHRSGQSLHLRYTMGILNAKPWRANQGDRWGSRSLRKQIRRRGVRSDGEARDLRNRDHRATLLRGRTRANRPSLCVLVLRSLIPYVCDPSADASGSNAHWRFAGLARYAVPADPSSPGTWLTEPNRRAAARLALYLVPFAGIAFLWFIGVLRSRLGELEDQFFATVFLASGLLFVATLFVAAA